MDQGQRQMTERVHALEVAQSTQAATQAGAATTTAAAQVGLVGAIIAGSVGLIVGIFLGITISNAHKH